MLSYELPTEGLADVKMLSLVLVVLGLGLDEAVLGLASSLLKHSEFFVELGHLRLSLVHQVIIL